MILNLHVTEENIQGYIYRSLNDADRETIEGHLSECPICRANIDQHQVIQRKIDQDLKASLNNRVPPRGMTFQAIAPRLEQNGLRRFLPSLSNAAPMATAGLGLILAIFGLWQAVGANSFSLTHVSTPNGAFPALACFFFMFVSMDQFDRSFSIRPRFVITVILALILWLGTFFIGLLNIIAVRDLTIAAYIFNGGSSEGASVVTILTVIIAAMFWIGTTIGGAEYHYKNIGHPTSWKLFSWTLIIQLFILVLPYLVL
jgi:hypothetical protein